MLGCEEVPAKPRVTTNRAGEQCWGSEGPILGIRADRVGSEGDLGVQDVVVFCHSRNFVVGNNQAGMFLELVEGNPELCKTCDKCQEFEFLFDSFDYIFEEEFRWYCFLENTPGVPGATGTLPVISAISQSTKVNRAMAKFLVEVVKVMRPSCYVSHDDGYSYVDVILCSGGVVIVAVVAVVVVVVVVFCGANQMN
ncbi:hypothetical protein BDK51DRAFT_32045 [Blyttiomyces helicus]|uniref:Uncharacterized protein n=1 Tax=Blyttiomyces helicus TaxID=388810 RepID=A0A4P9WNV0_9FUNG|nr:hypothetical protein BDK51DRAFT_32045 [Blyttiomyces helicus]|eukprot:RKO94821.1 hypothetical protein BDK51DRAFT_32045 [Blyttiomyces helicus]